MAEKMTDTGLKYEDLEEGTGTEAEAGKQVTVHYTGWLVDGTKFDSSLDRNQPFSFALGKGQVIRGWDEGVQGMKVGGKRKLTIPPQLGYGARGAGGVIPPNATLAFEVGAAGSPLMLPDAEVIGTGRCARPQGGRGQRRSNGVPPAVEPLRKGAPGLPGPGGTRRPGLVRRGVSPSRWRSVGFLGFRRW